MKKIVWFILLWFLLILYSCQKKNTAVPGNMILIKGGTFINTTSNLYKKDVVLKDYYLGKFEVTQKEWIEIMQSNPSQFVGDSLPVEMVSWYNCIEYCIKRSRKEGLQPYYKLYKDVIDDFNKSEFDSIKWLVKINPKANGYRLPTEIEWEYAAGGGQNSRNYIYSGSNIIDEVAWYWRNCGDTLLKQNWDYHRIKNNNARTHKVGSKRPNELGLYDMTGNVREWCNDWYQDEEVSRGYYRSQRGGGWIGIELYSTNNDRGYFEASGIGPDQGFRVCRSAI